MGETSRRAANPPVISSLLYSQMGSADGQARSRVRAGGARRVQSTWSQTSVSQNDETHNQEGSAARSTDDTVQ
eukprot:4153312-Pleurochrysis_carterae.AAC.2